MSFTDEETDTLSRENFTVRDLLAEPFRLEGPTPCTCQFTSLLEMDGKGGFSRVWGQNDVLRQLP